MLVQVVSNVASIAALSLALVSELVGWIFVVEIPLPADALGLTPAGLEAALYLAAVVLNLLGIVALRLFPRMFGPIGATTPEETHAGEDPFAGLERMPHVNDPLQSIYVAVIVIAGVLLIGAIS